MCQPKMTSTTLRNDNMANTLSSVQDTASIINTDSQTSIVLKPIKENAGPTGPPSNYCNRRSCISTDRMNELRRKAQESVKQNKTFTIRGCFSSVRNALISRGWVEKLDVHRKQIPSGICQVTFDELAQGLPKRKPGETRRQYIAKCERNIMSRFLEHMPIDFLWTNRKEKCDYIDQAKNPVMTINKFHRAPFTSKEGLCAQLKDFHWFYEEGTAEMYFPRCFNVWSLEELGEFVENFKLTSCIAFMRFIVDKYYEKGVDAIFSSTGKIPFNSIDFAYKRCSEYIDNCQHKDIDLEDPPKIWEHDWDAFLFHQYEMANEGSKIISDPNRTTDSTIKTLVQLLENIQSYWHQYSLDGYQNLWIVKPSNKCRGRGIQLMDNLKKILAVVNPSIASKSRYVVQKYIEKPMIIHHTKFDIRQWFLITNVQPLVIWVYKESYLRFSSQEYNLKNHHESVHLTNHAIQKKYTNGKRDKRLPTENMWDCYSFQAYLRQIGKHDMWFERIYPGMKKAIVGTMLASQENMDRRPNTFELFGADFMISEDFYPWLIEINSSPDLGATTSVTARMCPQCLEDVIKVVIDRRSDPKSSLGNFEQVYRQIVPPTPAYMGLNLFIKGKQIISKINNNNNQHHNYRKERSLNTSHFFRQRTALIPNISNIHKTMPTFNATEYIEKYMIEATSSSRSSISGGISQQFHSPIQLVSNRERLKIAVTIPTSPCPNLLRTPRFQIGVRRSSFTNLSKTGSAKDLIQHSTTKRHRSCGPSLAVIGNISNENNEKKFKFIIKKCSVVQKNMNIRSIKTFDSEIVSAAETGLCKFNNGPPMSSKSEDNIVELHRITSSISNNNHNKNKQSTYIPTHQKGLEKKSQREPSRSYSCFDGKKSLSRQILPEKSSVVEQKWKTLDTKSSHNNDNDDSKIVNANAINALGKSITTWKSARRSTRLLSAATTVSMKPSSVYICKKRLVATKGRIDALHP